LFKNGAKFEITSGAEILASDAFSISPSGNVSVTTVARVKDPAFQQSNYSNKDSGVDIIITIFLRFLAFFSKTML
jgi:hypothetical protein